MITSPGKVICTLHHQGNQSFLPLFMSSSGCIPKRKYELDCHTVACGQCFVNHQDSEFIGWKIGPGKKVLFISDMWPASWKLSWQHYILSLRLWTHEDSLSVRTFEKAIMELRDWDRLNGATGIGKVNIPGTTGEKSQTKGNRHTEKGAVMRVKEMRIKATNLWAAWSPAFGEPFFYSTFPKIRDASILLKNQRILI